MHDFLIFAAGYLVADLVMPVVRRWPPFDRLTTNMARQFDRMFSAKP